MVFVGGKKENVIVLYMNVNLLFMVGFILFNLIVV